MRNTDVLVIGGGLLGAFTARNLRRWNLAVTVLEAREDLCAGISRANTAVVYPGYDHKPGTQKAEMTVRANRAFAALCEALDVPFSRCGSIMAACGERGEAALRKKYQQGLENGVPHLQLLERDAVLKLEPTLTPDVTLGLYAPTTGTVNPWLLGIAAMENAVQNGAECHTNANVISIHAVQNGYRVETTIGDIFCRAIVNCAGLHAEAVQELIYPSPVRLRITAGDYLVLDALSEHTPTHIVQFEPEQGKGLTAVPTVEGALLLGPSEREGADFGTDKTGLDFVRNLTRYALPHVNLNDTIRTFAALRPNPERPDGSSIRSFVIDRPAAGFLSFLGVKTPGMTCANELGMYAARAMAEALGAKANPEFQPIRRGIAKAHGLDFEKRNALIAENPDYGEIVCCCEDVTRAEILAAIHSGAVTVDGVKRRVGTTMGRCQGSRCRLKIEEMLKEAGAHAP